MATAIETIATNPPNAAVRAFLDVGGRLMVDAKGAIKTGMDLERILGPRSTAKEARRGIIAARRFHRGFATSALPEPSSALWSSRASASRTAGS